MGKSIRLLNGFKLPLNTLSVVKKKKVAIRFLKTRAFRFTRSIKAKKIYCEAKLNVAILRIGSQVESRGGEVVHALAAAADQNWAPSLFGIQIGALEAQLLDRSAVQWVQREDFQP